MKNLKFIVISGLSGSGKSNAIKCFEDQGYFCIDNLPPVLLPKLVDLFVQTRSEVSKVALGIDIRERSFLGEFFKVYDALQEDGYRMELIFFEARDETLIRRFSETRRIHPLAAGKPVLEGISHEREILKQLRERADRVIDTTETNVHQLRAILNQIYFKENKSRKLQISLISFGYKHGVPFDADLLLDVRFLPNPHFEPELKMKTGLAPEVIKFVSQFPDAFSFIGKVTDMMEFLVPRYEMEGKSYLTMGIGCTGGRHRSVVIVNFLMDYFQKKGYLCSVRHRDIEVG